MKFLSYIYPQQLERITTKYNRDIRVQVEQGQPKLLVNGSRQSGKYIHGLWSFAMQKLHIVPALDISSILVLGVGGGTVIHMLHEMYPTAIMTGVDIDSDMIRIGKAYFGLSELENLTLREANAQQFVKTTKKKFDLLIIDLFSGREIPDFVLSHDFHIDCKKILYKDGKVLINYLREKEYGKKAEVLEKLLKDLYKNIAHVDCFNNRFFMVEFTSPI